MAIAVQTTVYPAPGSPERPVSLKPRYENFIGGHWVAPVEGAYSANPSPATGQPFCEVAPLCEVARSTAHDVDLALGAAHAARETSTTDRAKVLSGRLQRPGSPGRPSAEPTARTACARGIRKTTRSRRT